MQKNFFTKKVNKIKVFKKHRKQINYLLGNYKHSTLKARIRKQVKTKFDRIGKISLRICQSELK